eukprot:GHVU01140351.1.p1 GENE.GHVU01140351.1~~GHVU01140351.1.p1  ORF type:complete len:291 (+),score=42.48 GHVU01140351.1:1214-2086(+)
MNEHEDIDLNIDNYNLDDLLGLFKLGYNFTENDMKQAKRIVLKTHPDKSKMDKKYFLFFSRAYKVLYSIHQFRTQSNSEKSTVYTIEKDEAKEKFIKSISKTENFHKVFNEFFDNNYIRTDDIKTGYGDWLKSDEDLNDDKISNMTQMNETFEKKKNTMRALAKKEEIKDTSNESYLNLSGNTPESYSSSLFSNLQYEDLKKAHVETVIPVSRQDYEEKQKFSNMNDLKMYRDTDNVAPVSLQQSKQLLKNQQNLENKNSVMRAFELAKQDEISKKTSSEWLTRFKQLNN